MTLEQIAHEEIKLLARKAQLLDELKSIDTALGQLRAFAQGFAAATPKEDPQPTEE